MTTTLQPTSMFLTVNELRLHYLDWGRAGAPPIVCVHGYTSSAEAFNALNTPIRGNVQSTSFTSPVFGVIPNSQENFPRNIQLALKLQF